MQESHSNSHINDPDNEINLRELFYVLLQGKWIIVSLTAFVSIAAVIYSLSLPNIYHSKSLLAPVNSSAGMSGALGGIGSLAGLAGISIPSSINEGNSTQAKEKLSSLSFFKKNILPNIFLPDLMAVKSWNFQTNVLTYDENLYDKDTNTWVRDFAYPNKQIPSAQESFRAFKEHFNLSEDKKTGFLTLTVKHQSPYIANQWAELLIEQVNTFYRQKDKSESEKALSYLNEQIAMTGLAEIRQVIAQLLLEETKKLTLIEANQSYVFDYIDQPEVMELKSEPARAFICILSALLGGFFSIVLVLIKHYGFREEAS